jgi:hypothetical protein
VGVAPYFATGAVKPANLAAVTPLSILLKFLMDTPM